MAEILHVVTSNDRRGAEVFAADLDAALSDRGHDSRLLALANGRSDNRLAARFEIGVVAEAWDLLLREVAAAHRYRPSFP